MLVIGAMAWAVIVVWARFVVSNRVGEAVVKLREIAEFAERAEDRRGY
jgi:hypothetical protein